MVGSEFSIVSGALGIAALFNDCVECFEYIQIGRRCTQDFATSQLRLDFVRTRLTRWGNAVNITSEDCLRVGYRKEREEVFKILSQMYSLFQSAEKVAVKYKQNSQPGHDLQVFREQSDLDNGSLALHTYLQSTALKRKSSIGLRRKTAWALYERQYLTDLIESIEKLLENLEILCPAKEERRQLATYEIEELSDEHTLTLLIEAVENQDELLEAAARNRLFLLQDDSRIEELEQKDNARVRVGPTWTETALHVKGAGAKGGRQSVGKASVSNNGRLQVGPTYGRKDIFDE